MSIVYDPYVVLPEEVASSVIFYQEKEEDFEAHLKHVRNCGLVSRIWSFCIAKYALISARNEFSAANYVAARLYFQLSSNLNVDPSSPASIYCEFALYVYRQINNPRRGCEVGFIEESLNKDSDEKSKALLDLITHCLQYSCPEERSTYFEPPSSPKKSVLVQRSLDTNKLFSTPLIPLPVEPRSLTLRTIEQILSLLEVKDFDINKLLEMIREFATQGPAERKYLASRYIIPRLVNLHLGHANNPMRHPDTDSDDYTQQITTEHQLAVVFMIGAKLDKHYAKSVQKSDSSEKMDCEPSAGSATYPIYEQNTSQLAVVDDGTEEIIPTTQLDLDMLFHQSFIKDVILFSPDITKTILPLIKDFVHHWSYENETKLPFFSDLFNGLFKSSHRKSSLVLDLLDSYTQIQDDLTDLRVEFTTDLLMQQTIGSISYDEAPLCAQLMLELTRAHPCACSLLLERRKEWLVKFYTAPRQPQLAQIAEEIMTDVLWSQTDKQPVELLTETFLSTFEEKPLEVICTMNLSNLFNAVEFLILQLENKDLLINALPTFMKTMVECNKMKLREDRNNVATLTFLKSLMINEAIGTVVMTHVTDPDFFKQLLEWHHEAILKVENEYHCEFYTFNHLSLYYSVIQLCCEFEPKCLKLAMTNEAFINIMLSHVVFAPIYLADGVSLVSELLEQAVRCDLKADLELFYSRFNTALLQATAKNDFLVANFEWIVRLLDESLQYPALRENFVGSAKRPRAPGLQCLARLVQKATDIDPFGIYNFDTTKLLWRLYELINDVVQETAAYSTSPELIWSNLHMNEQDKGTADGLLQAVITINERLLPPESTAFNLGTKLIDAINYEKDLINKKTTTTDEAPAVSAPEPNPVVSTATDGSRCSTQ